MDGVNEFISFFEKIPDQNIISGDAFDNCGNYCSGGWIIEKLEAGSYTCLDRIFIKVIGYSIPTINDGYCYKYNQPTPKQRILAALYDIRDKELSEANLKEASKIVSENKIEVYGV